MQTGELDAPSIATRSALIPEPFGEHHAGTSQHKTQPATAFPGVPEMPG